MNDMRKLMEAVQLDEYERTEPIYIEYRDPDGEFVVKYRASRGYYVEGDGADSAPSFENLDDAIEHGEISIMSYGDAIEEEGDEGTLNDRYDDDTLECKHCGDYFCTSKFGGECPGIQRDMFDNE